MFFYHLYNRMPKTSIQNKGFVVTVIEFCQNPSSPEFTDCSGSPFKYNESIRVLKKFKHAFNVISGFYFYINYVSDVSSLKSGSILGIKSYRNSFSPAFLSSLCCRIHYSRTSTVNN